LFTGKPQFDLVDTTPLNLTPEEEKFYYSLIDTLKNHRGNISLEKLSEDDESSSQPIIKPKETQTNTLTSEPVVEEKPEPEPIVEDKPEEIKPVVEEKPEPKPVVEDKPKEVKPQPKPKVGNIEDNPNAFDPQEEFFDFESKKVAKETELVTMLVFDDVDAIVGVDEKVYGPFRPQDIVTLPMVNAKIFFKNRKGRQVRI
jgi:DNA replication factor GINS